MTGGRVRARVGRPTGHEPAPEPISHSAGGSRCFVDWKADVTFYAHAKAPEPIARRLSWPKLCEALSTFRPALPDKRLTPAWSPAAYPAGTERRSSSAVSALSCVVLDFDSGVSPDVARAPWMDWPHLVHTSYSHTEGAPKFRLVVPLASPVLRDGWARVWWWAVRRSGLAPDPQCKDPSRIYFLPVARGPFWSLVHDADGGAMLDVDPARLPPTPTEEDIARRRAAPRPRSARLDRNIGEALKSSADARTALGEVLGATIRGGRCEHVPCPGCKKPSVWWWIEPGPQAQAVCDHRNSCGWRGWLDTLLPEGVR